MLTQVRDSEARQSATRQDAPQQTVLILPLSRLMFVSSSRWCGSTDQQNNRASFAKRARSDPKMLVRHDDSQDYISTNARPAESVMGRFDEALSLALPSH